MLQEFKSFILRGSIIDLAVGVLIGTAFGKIVDAFTLGIIKPLLQAVGGDPQVAMKIWVFDVGLVISALLSFLITAAILFFVFIKPINRLVALGKKAEPAVLPPEKSDEVKLLEEIRDLLKKS